VFDDIAGPEARISWGSRSLHRVCPQKRAGQWRRIVTGNEGGLCGLENRRHLRCAGSAAIIERRVALEGWRVDAIGQRRDSARKHRPASPAMPDDVIA